MKFTVSLMSFSVGLNALRRRRATPHTAGVSSPDLSRGLLSSVCFLLATLTPALLAPPATAYETNVLVRDPSTIVERNGTYWVYGTGRGTQQFSSTDRVHWTKRGSVFPQAPAWVAEKVPGNTTNEVWAPDIHLINGKYFLYYSYSQFGTNISGIGVATSTTLAPDSWKDGGLVLASAGTDYNAIDPCIFQDAEGNPWLSFGSYFSGIKLMRVDPTTGLRLDGAPISNIAARPGPNTSLEASTIYFHDGYYYLFVNFDNCCAGAKSAYNIRIGRARAVTGPYLDRDGKDLMQGGGSLFVNATFDNGTGRTADNEVGPGHVGIYKQGNNFLVSTHYEWARDKDGATTMNINRLAWDTDGWPRFLLDAGPYKLVSNLPTHNSATFVANPIADASFVQDSPDESSKTQRWTLTYLGDGYYSLTNASNNLALGVVGDAKEHGAHVELKPFTNRTGQAWYLQQNDDGTYTLLSKSSGKTIALDVGGCSPNDGASIATWDANGMDCQKWSLRLR